MKHVDSGTESWNIGHQMSEKIYNRTVTYNTIRQRERVRDRATCRENPHVCEVKDSACCIEGTAIG
jgi:hypothetical protein